MATWKGLTFIASLTSDGDIIRRRIIHGLTF